MRKKQYLALIVMILVSLSCDTTLSPQVLPTQGPGAVETMIVLTADAADTMTQAALPPLTATPLPTRTGTYTPLPPTETPVPTATFFFSLPTPTKTATLKVIAPPPVGGGGGGGSSGGGSVGSCQNTSQTPTDNVEIQAGTDFDVVWVIKNTSNFTWGKTDYDYIYYEGDKIHKKNLYDLPETVKPGESVELVVDMLAPSKTGKYSTTWRIKGDNLSCYFDLIIKVVK